MKHRSNIIVGAVIALLVVIIVVQYVVYHTSDGNSPSSLSAYLSNLAHEATGNSGSSTTTTQTSATIPATGSASGPIGTYARPVIYSLTPSEGTSGLTVTISGQNFDRTSNYVSFGTYDGRHSVNGLEDTIVADSPSYDGKLLTFKVPLTGPSGLLCDATGKNCTTVAAVVLPSGTYPVTVTSKGGESNTLYFTLTH